MGCQNCQRFDFAAFGAQEDTIQMLEVLVATEIPRVGYSVERQTWCAACWDAARKGMGRKQWTERGKLFRGNDKRRVSLL